MPHCLLIVFLLCFSVTSYAISPAQFIIPSFDNPPVAQAISSLDIAINQIYLCGLMAMHDINNSTDILPNTELILEEKSEAVGNAIPGMMQAAENNQTLVLLNIYPEAMSTVGTVLGVSQLSSLITQSDLSDKSKFPYYSRLTPPPNWQFLAFKDTILYYGDGRIGWNDVAIISTTDDFTVQLANDFNNVAGPELRVISYRQYIPFTGPTTIQNELTQIKLSGARVIVAILYAGWDEFIKLANDVGIVGDNYVWLVPSIVVGLDFEDQEARELSRGTIGFFQDFPNTPEKENFLTRFNEQYGDLFDTPVTPYGFLQYDMVKAAGVAVDTLDKQNLLSHRERIPPELWTTTLNSLRFEGVSGFVSFDNQGDRIANISVQYYSPEGNQWKPTALWSRKNGYSHLQDVVWLSNTTKIPDLDVRTPYGYWSCHSKERGYDETGKTVELHTPDGRDVDDIDSTYLCDEFIDCKNISDESYDCSLNYVVLYFVFGIITGLLILITLLTIPFVILFGLFLGYRRVRTASPHFLLLLSFSIIVGYTSIFAWFGKPHTISCVFQTWLLGLAAISMITALSVKNFRIWQIFRKNNQYMRITNLELLLYWAVVMLPAVIILALWTGLATPIATMMERDGKDHYICSSGSVTGSIGGLIFSIIFIVYGAFVLSGGAVLAIVTRNIPSQFNESKLVAISIYNLGFLSVVIIPVFIVLDRFEPKIGWIVRSCAILYAFTATLFLQYAPMLFGIFITDKGRNVKVFKSNLSLPRTPLDSNTNTNHTRVTCSDS